MGEVVRTRRIVTRDHLAVLEKGFMEYLNHTRYPGYGANLLRYDPDAFYKAMRSFYAGREKDI